jgi:prevent-host-death family protein
MAVGKRRAASSERPERKRRRRHDVRPSACWQLQTAKAQFSEVFRRALANGPQWVTRQNKEAVVILPAEEFERLARRARQPESLVRFFADSPLAKVALDLRRPRDYGRDVDL